MDLYVRAIVIPLVVCRDVRDHSAAARIGALGSVALGSDGGRDVEGHTSGGIHHGLMEMIAGGGVEGANDLELMADWELDEWVHHWVKI